MALFVGFATSIAVSVTLLLGVVLSGRAARRRLHLGLVSATLVSLVIAVVYATLLGQRYDLEAAGWITPVHTALSRIGVLALLLPIGAGLLTLRRPQLRRLHGRLAYLALAVVVITATTGAWMLLAAPPL